ncbi:MAG: KDO2-lipid IV(A) lauroyltransferase [Gammaproteobacteria bacterium]|jgi:KDO2-lipid IV(A) lauroyltransferase
MNHKAFNYWVIEPFWGGIDYLVFLFLRCLSLKQVSNIGSVIGNIAKNRFKKASSDTIANIEYLAPQLHADEVNNKLNTMWKNIARTLTEMSVLDKFDLVENSEQYNLKIFDNLDSNHPVVFLFPHLGNWELLAMSVINQGFKLNVIYEAVPNRFQRRLLVKSRQRVGYELISPDYSGTRKIFKALSNGQSIGMAMDEFKNEKIIAPVFSGKLQTNSNIHYALGLARRFKTPIVYVYCKREAGVKFSIHYAEPIIFDAPQYIDMSDIDIAEIINQKCREWVIENLDQWYMLHRARIKY